MDIKKKNEIISLVIISYNQENYIRDAILSAFNQDFDNYEVVISDDCSTDNTWNIINETVKAKEHSSLFEIILNRNSENLGIVRNYQKALSLTKGNWIVASAGDDISKPNRLKVISELSNSEENIFAIGTGYDLINSKGGYLSKNNPCIQREINIPLYPGFAAAINRKTFIKFPRIEVNVQSEDIIYTLRALELGTILLANISTVEHRIHSHNVTSKGITIEAYEGKIRNHQNAIKTLEYYKLKEVRNENLNSLIDLQIKKFEKNIEHYEFVILYYKMNLWERILNLSKINSTIKNDRFYTYFYRIKIFLEYYGDISLLENRIKKIVTTLYSIKTNIRNTNKSFARRKSYKIVS